MRWFLALLLCCGGWAMPGCGGGGADSPATQTPAPLKKALLHASDKIVTDPGYDLHIQPRTETDIAANVLAQSKIPGTVILWAGFTKGEGFLRFPAFLAEAVKYPNIRYAYIFDEADWDGQRYVPGLHREAIYQASDQARIAGLLPVITIMPEVILQPGFSFDVSRFAIIGIDIYPSVSPRGLPPIEPCIISDNALSNLLGCSIAKLRRLGFKGGAVYVAQGFGLLVESEAALLTGLTLQRETIDNARALGADGVMSYGLHLSAEQMAAEPFFPLAGTWLEAIVMP